MAIFSALKQNITRLLLFVLPIFFLISCLDINTEIILKNEGSSRVSLSYVFESDFADFGRGFGADEPWPFPLTEKDFIQQSLRFPGVELKRYRVHIESDGRERIDVKLDADTLENLSLYLGINMEMQTSNDGGTFVMAIPSAEDYADSDLQFRESLEKIIGDSSFTISIRPPSAPSRSNPGKIDGKSAVLELSLIDLLNNTTPENWVVNW